MHDPAKPPDHSGIRSVSRRRALTYALRAPVVLAFGPAVTTFAAHKASAAELKLIDFTHRQVAPDLIKAAGFAGALVYVSELRPGADFDFKPVTKSYTDALRAAGLHVVSCYQYGKPGWPTPSDYTRGHAGGVADGRTALRLHSAAGGPATAPIFFSIDEDIDADTWNGVAVEWLRGVNSVLGVERTGVYGHARVCAWAIADGVIGRSTTPGHWWAWQTRAWSGGEREPRAVLYQSVVVTASDPGVRLGNTSVDVDEVLAADFGQWDLDRG
ncbi:DUF1906 domain-containing protein [Mycobacterium sp. PS03-16]|uniref:DUF1906 domain-containing protein n=1 Tax=Mycobacterium sp. PS03-16 TaxID=2559611 RepID=UPI0010731B7D|nr:DUF1906 domain-containing protein [Mycobacterium sp. PS03-16]TFV60235.1 DUF1906 domain-containing protein [Mycobacterium sp. PS03-16]